MKDVVIVAEKSLMGFCRTIFHTLGMPDEDAAYAAECIVKTNMWGVDSHGVIRMPIYAERLHNGAVNPVPNVSTVREFGSLAQMDGDNGLGYVVARKAMDKAISLAARHGVGSVAVRNSNHFGAAAIFVRQAAAAGMIGIAMADTLPNMVGPGSRVPAVGNNPIAFGAPFFGERPFVFDLSLSQVAGGKLLMAKEKGEKIPLDWAVDVNGNPTNDPVAGFAGSFLPVGGHKGYGLALVVELLSGLLSGGMFLGGVKSMHKEPEEPSRTSHHMMAINPAALMDKEEWAARMRTLRDELKAVPMREGASSLVFPGELEDACETARMAEGIPLPLSVRDDLLKTAARFAPQAKLS
ncbi:MAG: putative oxidoreductase YjmC [Desulfovibrio sp.]